MTKDLPTNSVVYEKPGTSIRVFRNDGAFSMKSQANTDVYTQYSQDETIAKYISETAGDGIAYVLRHIYTPIYVGAIRDLLSVRPKGHPFRILEYGCGGGMNLLRVAELVQSEGATLERGYGVDFAAPMIEAARKEAVTHLSPEMNSRLTYAVAGNENLANDLCRAIGTSRKGIAGTFDVIFGVNTARYAHRLNRENELALDIFEMLRPAGQTIMIDMNRYFPFFRSRLRDKLTRRGDETYIPSLNEYTRPFRAAGFEITQSRNFCWIPHSANPKLLALCRAVAPVLDMTCSPLAMRSLVVGRKPL